jgi:alkanesulfonate monooxygenase SsuD/methylene tetrahydromethanopterin reductase-like flavin-dependent oxidoreductase (luciferase family)
LRAGDQVAAAVACCSGFVCYRVHPEQEETMQIGCSAPTSGPLIGPDSLLRIATEAENLGYDYVTVSDHVMIPTSIASRYPYSDSGEFPSGAAAPRLEQLTAATFIAAATSKLRIVTSVMVVPHRPAVLTAKILATIDYLSKGRLTPGIGEAIPQRRR